MILKSRFKTLVIDFDKKQFKIIYQFNKDKQYPASAINSVIKKLVNILNYQLI